MQGSSVFAWVAVALCAFALRMDDSPEGGAELTPGDAVRITVEEAPELTMEGLLEEDGTIDVPTLGRVELGGLPTLAAEQALAAQLQLAEPSMKTMHVHIQVLQEHAYLSDSNQTSARRID